MSCLLLVSLGAFAQKQEPARPKISGIDHVAFYTTSPEANDKFYENLLGLVSPKADKTSIEPGQTQVFWIGSQWVGYSPAPDAKSINQMDHLAFTTESIEALRAYLTSEHVPVSNATSAGDGSKSFAVNDPEGTRIEFVERNRMRFGTGLGRLGTLGEQAERYDPISSRIIHAGFIVHDRAAEDHFYKDILGFPLYWQGGMENDRADWVAMQVPDGTDWVEYMLNIKPDADQRLTGVMNHVSLGVKDIKAAQAKLEARGWKANGREHAQMGRDGKWQLNLYDPDQTRIELMEFTPTGKTCCSEFQGQHPHE